MTDLFTGVDFALSVDLIQIFIVVAFPACIKLCEFSPTIFASGFVFENFSTFCLLIGRPTSQTFWCQHHQGHVQIPQLRVEAVAKRRKFQRNFRINISGKMRAVLCRRLGIKFFEFLVQSSEEDFELVIVVLDNRIEFYQMIFVPVRCEVEVLDCFQYCSDAGENMREVWPRDVVAEIVERGNQKSARTVDCSERPLNGFCFLNLPEPKAAAYCCNNPCECADQSCDGIGRLCVKQKDYKRADDDADTNASHKSTIRLAPGNNFLPIGEPNDERRDNADENSANDKASRFEPLKYGHRNTPKFETSYRRGAAP